MHLHLSDHQYPFQGITHHRPNARALIQREDGLFFFNHILCLDRFGQRDYLETPGGGLNEGETPEEAVLREVEEECGLKGQMVLPIGLIEDDYHLIQRHNLNHYFYLRVIGKGEKHWTEEEKRLIHQQVWLSLDEALAWYHRLPDVGIAQLIKQRELPVLQWLKRYLNLGK
jgi:8-oxo-dGTP pyrophosphatase MutT (NUDIX family)